MFSFFYIVFIIMPFHLKFIYRKCECIFSKRTGYIYFCCHNNRFFFFQKKSMKIRYSLNCVTCRKVSETYTLPSLKGDKFGARLYVYVSFSFIFYFVRLDLQLCTQSQGMDPLTVVSNDINSVKRQCRNSTQSVNANNCEEIINVEASIKRLR